jgi:hypothetical protein
MSDERDDVLSFGKFRLHWSVPAAGAGIAVATAVALAAASGPAATRIVLLSGLSLLFLLGLVLLGLLVTDPFLRVGRRPSLDRDAQPSVAGRIGTILCRLRDLRLSGEKQRSSRTGADEPDAVQEARRHLDRQVRMYLHRTARAAQRGAGESCVSIHSPQENEDASAATDRSPVRMPPSRRHPRAA